MDLMQCFASTYSEARQRFLVACDAAELTVRSLRHPMTGAEGEGLYVDTAWLGPNDAKRLIVISSGTHGIEGFTGSACQVALLRSGIFNAMPPKVSVFFIHAVNPYGFSHQRRVAEGNIDLNRSFVAHEDARGTPTAYDELATLFSPEGDEATIIERGKLIAERAETMGIRAFQRAVSGGQYSHADGLFYGGVAPSWSFNTIVHILNKYIRGHRLALLVDLHAGLGKYGHGELISLHRVGSSPDEALRQWFGEDLRSIERDESVATRVRGTLAQGFVEELEEMAACAVTLEFGTKDFMSGLEAIRMDNWLHHGNPKPEATAERIREEMRSIYFPSDPTWRQDVLVRSQEVMARAADEIARF